MRKFTKLTRIAAATAVLSAIAATAYAATVIRNDALPAPEAKVSMLQALSIAEQAGNGKVTRAEYEKTKDGWVYDVEVISQNKVLDIRIDADKGTVISSKEDTADHDDENDKQD
jgi:uncharacterized membrane protein YkoI